MGSGRMILHGGPISPFVRKVGICLIEKQLEGQVDFVRSVTAMARANLELLPHNPLSKIPTLIASDGAVLFDSDVICEYLDAQYGGTRLFPQSGAARWQALRWNALGSGALDALVLWRFERNRPQQQQSAAVLEAYATKFAALMKRLEAEMPTLATAPFGIGHIPIGCLFGYLDFRFPDLAWRAGHPRCELWFAEFMTRASARRTVPYEQRPPADAADHLWQSI